MSDFPAGIYSPRTKQNRTGVTYDATKSKVFFAEDVSKLDDEVVAIENALGTNPAGSADTLSDRVARLEAALGFDFDSPARVLLGRTYVGPTGGKKPVFVDQSNSYYYASIALAGRYMNKMSFRIFKSTDGGILWSQLGTDQSFSSITNISTSAGWSIAVDSNGNVGLVFAGYGAASATVVNIYFSFWDGNSWSAPETVSSITTAGYDANSVDMDVDSGGNFHVVWVQKNAGSTTSPRLQYNRRTSGAAGAWDGKTDLDDANGNASMSYIVCDSNDKPRIIFRDGGNSNYITLATNASGAWVSTASNQTGSIYAIAKNLDDRIYVSQGTANLYYVTNVPAWGSIANCFTRFSNPQDIAVDLDGNIYCYGGVGAEFRNDRASSRYNIVAGSEEDIPKIFSASGYNIGAGTSGFCFKQCLAVPKILVYGYAGVFSVVDLY